MYLILIPTGKTKSLVATIIIIAGLCALLYGTFSSCYTAREAGIACNYMMGGVLTILGGIFLSALTPKKSLKITIEWA